MFQVRIHGRGGQGVVSGAELLSVAAFLEGHHAQAFPSFGSERMGAPVMAFCRIDDRPIRLREPVLEPDALLIQDATLLHQVSVFDGLREDAVVLINTTASFETLGLTDLQRRLPPQNLCAVPATELALSHIGRAVPNAALLGAFAEVTGRLSMLSISAALREKFPPKVAAGNIGAATAAYELMRAQRGLASAAPATPARPIFGSQQMEAH